MKQINVKLLAILFISTLTVLIGAFFLYRFQKQRNADGLLLRAKTQKEEGNFKDEVKYLKRYLSLRPDHDEIYVDLALALQGYAAELRQTGELSGQMLSQAYGFTEEALRKNPENMDLRRTAVDFSMSFRRFQDALSHLSMLMKGERAEDPELQVLLAQCLTQSGQESKATPTLCKMVGFDRNSRSFNPSQASAPNNIDAYFLLSQIYAFREGDPQTGNLVIDQLVKANPDSHDAHLKRASYYSAQKDKRYESIIDEEINQALKLEPENTGTIIAAARYAMNSEQFDKAKALYERCLNLDPKSAAAFGGLSTWALNNRDINGAIGFLNKGLEENNENRDLLWKRANIELDAGRTQEAKKTRDRLDELKHPRPFIDLIDGRIDLADKNWLTASKKLEDARVPIAQFQPSWLPGIDANLALCYEKMNQHDLQLQALQRIVEADPSNIRARWSIVQALLAMGQMEKAAEQYSTIERQLANTGTKMPVNLLSYHFRMELYQQSRLPKSKQNYADADRIFQQLRENGLLSSKEIQKLAYSYYNAKGQPDKAKELREYIIKRYPSDPAIVLEEVRRIAAKDGLDAAIAAIDSRFASTGAPLTIRMLRAELMAQLDPEKAKESLKLIEKDLGAMPDDRRVELTRAVGRIYLVMGELDETRRVWADLSKDRPNDVQVRLSLFELALQAGDEDGMKEVLAGVADLVGRESAEWQWAKSVHTAWRVRNNLSPKEELEDAQALVYQAINQRKGWEALYRLAGEIHVLKNEAAAAIEMLEKSLEISSGHPAVFRSLARLYYDDGRLDESEKMLSRLPRSMRSKLDQRIEMDILSRKGKLPEKLPYNVDSEDPNDHLWTGKLLTNAKRFEDAEKAFRRCIELEPSSREAWTALAKMYMAADNRDAATQLMRDAQLKLSEQDIAVFLGETHAMLGDWEEAAENLKIAIEANPDKQGLKRALAEVYVQSRLNQEAKLVIDELLKDAKPHDPAATPEVRWARQMKARLMASDGSYHEFTEAKRVIEENGPKDGIMAPSDLVLWARLSASRPDGLSREQAIDKLESTKDARQLTTEEQKVLADLYQRQDRWVDCKSVMLGLLADNPNDLTLLDPWLRWLLEHDEEQEAIRWLDNCPPGSVAALRTQSHIDARRGQSERAVKRLARLIPKDATIEDAGKLKLVAEIVEQLGEYDPRMYGVAEKAWRRYVKVQPTENLALAAFLGRRGGDNDVPESLRICGEHLEDGRQLAALQLAVAILRRNRGVADMPKYENVVRGWFKTVSEENENELTLLIQRAEFEDVVGNFTEAERYLRDYLGRSEISNRQKAIVANNLAYMLALRGKTEEPMTLVKYAVDILGPTADLRDTLGMVYLAKGDIATALLEFEAAIGDGGATPYKYLHVAMAKFQEGDNDGSIKALDRSHTMGLEIDQLTPLEFKNYSDLIKSLKESGALTDETIQKWDELMAKGRK